MDILTLEIFDVTVSQALLKVRGAIEQHPTMPLRILVDSDEMVRSNLERFLERQGRPATTKAMGDHWQLDVAGGTVPQETFSAFKPVAPAPVVARPVLLLRSAFTPGDRALGRQLLLGVLSALETGTPWILLAHDALELLEDPSAVECLENLQQRGIPIHVSEASLRYLGRSAPRFLPTDDKPWQSLLAKGELTVL